FGMPGVRCDGNDVLATHAVVSEAVARARAGGGPTLIEAVTYRLEAHTTSDDPTRYRSDEEVAAWRARDPIARVDAYLARGGLLTEESRDAIDTRAHNAAQRLRESVVGATDFSPSELFDHVFVDSTPALREQREQLRAELESGFDQ